MARQIVPDNEVLVTLNHSGKTCPELWRIFSEGKAVRA